ncbi:MAG: N-formylglutamate amidohydrolase [Robiginitomaculum sp.]|nr:N-formylglutamate amidohydrolase [Robiginitomaculum sp.]
MWSLNKRKYPRAEKQSLHALLPAFEVLAPPVLKSPIILASPHSGRHYPASFLQQTSVSLAQLRQSEDSYVDEMIKPLAQYDIPVLHALFPRCFVDVNRSANDWPPESISRRSVLDDKNPFQAHQRYSSSHAHAGLGVIPTRISHGLPIYAYPLAPKLIQARLDTLYHPYHEALQALIGMAKSKFGHAIVLDFHSMPGEKVSGKKRADFILGDRFGKSCAPETINTLHKLLSARGYTVTRNLPYAGGFITDYYGQVSERVDAVQIEINKDLYLDQDTLTPHSGMGKLIEDIQKVVLAFKDTDTTTMPLAAQ